MAVDYLTFDRIEWKYLTYGKSKSAEKMIEIMELYLPETDIVVDIGCGAGGLSHYSHYFDRYVGIELEFNALRKAKESRSNEGCFFICSDSESLPIRSNCVKSFVSICMLEHTQNPGDIIKEIYRVSNGKGIFVLPCKDTLPFFYDPINYILLKLNRKPCNLGAFGYGHINVLNKEQWRELILQAGFKINKVLPYDNSLLTQIEFFLFSLLTTGSSHYSDLPVKTVSKKIYRLFSFIHKGMSFFDINTKKAFAQCFVVSK